MELEQIKQDVRLVALEFISASTADVGRQRRSLSAAWPKGKVSADFDVISRVHSEAVEAKLKRRMSLMLDPLNEQPFKSLRSSIANFDKNVLRKTNRRSLDSHISSLNKEINSFEKTRLHRTSLDSLALERNQRICRGIKGFDKGRLRAVQRSSIAGKVNKSLPLLSFCESTHSMLIPESPMTYAVLRLDQIGQSIMHNCATAMEEGIDRLHYPMEHHQEVTYEHFSLVVRQIMEKRLTHLTKSVWSKVALVLYLVKEVLYSGNLSGIEVKLLVNYAIKFVAERFANEISEEGGWAALEWPSNLDERDPAIAFEYCRNETEPCDRFSKTLTHIGIAFAFASAVAFLYPKLFK